MKELIKNAVVVITVILALAGLMFLAKKMADADCKYNFIFKVWTCPGGLFEVLPGTLE